MLRIAQDRAIWIIVEYASCHSKVEGRSVSLIVGKLLAQNAANLYSMTTMAFIPKNESVKTGSLADWELNCLYDIARGTISAIIASIPIQFAVDWK